MKHTHKTSGYTFLEVLVAIAIFAFVLTITTTITVNFYNAQKKERVRNQLIEETQFLLNRVANLVRNNTIDYSEYYAQSRNTTVGWINHDADYRYGKYPKEYEWNFYYVEDCDPGESPFQDPLCVREDPNNFNEGLFNTFADNDGGASDDPAKYALSALGDAGITDDHEQLELYLVDSTGTKKTILRRMDNKIDDDNDGSIDEDKRTDAIGRSYWDPAGTDKIGGSYIDGGERLGILELEATDDFYSIVNASGTPSSAEPDGILDFETESEDFQEDGDHLIEYIDTLDPDRSDFVPISPRNINITDLRFIISPLDDPRKAFSEIGTDSQIQPHVTILITTSPGQSLLRQLPGDPFEISIQTTITSRTLTNVLLPDP